MGSPARVLVVDDDEDQRTTLARMVAALGYDAQTAFDGQDALEKLGSYPAHVLVTDLVMPRLDGRELLRALRQHHGPPAIVLTAHGSLEKAVSTVKDLGAFWYLEKPIEMPELSLLLERAASQSLLRQETDRLHRQLSYQGMLVDLVGKSPAMQQVFSLIRQVAEHNACVLITGESGTGKELAARAIHRLSARSGRPFIAVNCAALPESLIESELFGHEKGSFTGAVTSRPGCFELAHTGTLLLDEIGEMPIGTQAKLLRVLEDSRVRRLGGKAEFATDVHVIAATNRDPEEAVHKGQLRMDLYYRLNVFQIALPPLRERKDDIPLLVESMLGPLNEKFGCKVADVEPEAMAAFHKHNWPGNVRELRNVLSRAVILAGEGTIQMRHLPPGFAGSVPAERPAPRSSEAGLFIPIGYTVRDAERVLIERTLQYAGNNKTRAAAILGIGLKTLHTKLKEYREADGQPVATAEEA
ncbi:MAG: sigma-54-dependent Fis family transcriptional regulator [Bryobacteraceae bacterium]|nr:sigma-54-dependent Fis family transcriptional regulator [Bryobacteraceae bacterium]